MAKNAAHHDGPSPCRKMVLLCVHKALLDEVRDSFHGQGARLAGLAQGDPGMRKVSNIALCVTGVAFVAGVATLLATPAKAGELQGPARFCGYSPIIDLEADERVKTLTGGIHGGTFLWTGSFGSLEVSGVGWARRPEGKIVLKGTGGRPARFAQRKIDGEYEIAIWNGAHGAAYFRSANELTEAQINAIDRVRLFEEGQEPEGCDLRTSFFWG